MEKILINPWCTETNKQKVCLNRLKKTQHSYHISNAVNQFSICSQDEGKAKEQRFFFKGKYWQSQTQNLRLFYRELLQNFLLSICSQLCFDFSLTINKVMTKALPSSIWALWTTSESLRHGFRISILWHGVAHPKPRPEHNEMAQQQRKATGNKWKKENQSFLKIIMKGQLEAIASYQCWQTHLLWHSQDAIWLSACLESPLLLCTRFQSIKWLVFNRDDTLLVILFRGNWKSTEQIFAHLSVKSLSLHNPSEQECKSYVQLITKNTLLPSVTATLLAQTVIRSISWVT